MHKAAFFPEAVRWADSEYKRLPTVPPNGSKETLPGTYQSSLGIRRRLQMLQSETSNDPKSASSSSSRCCGNNYATMKSCCNLAKFGFYSSRCLAVVGAAIFWVECASTNCLTNIGFIVFFQNPMRRFKMTFQTTYVSDSEDRNNCDAAIQFLLSKNTIAQSRTWCCNFSFWKENGCRKTFAK